jgi:hypothetical protein
MKRIRTGTVGPNKVVILKQAEGGMRRLRCLKCQQLAVPVTKPNGKVVYRCACGAEYSARAL